MLIFPYAVKYNGVIYPANTPIEEVKVEPLEKVETKVEAPKGEKKPTRKRVAKGDE